MPPRRTSAFSPLHQVKTSALACAVFLVAIGCNRGEGVLRGIASQAPKGAPSTGAAAGPHACAMITQAEMEAIVGTRFGSIEDNTEAGQSSTECNYNPPADAMAPRVSLTVERGESVMDAKAGLAGASAGGSLGAQVAGEGAAQLPGMRHGPVEGVGDEAVVSMNLLTVRKGSTLILVQASLINDPFKMVTDTLALNDQLEKAKQIARAVIAKL